MSTTVIIKYDALPDDVLATLSDRNTDELQDYADELVSQSADAAQRWNNLQPSLCLLASERPYTYRHSLRVGLYAYSLALQAENDGPATLVNGTLHDAGKLDVDAGLVEYPDQESLTDEEYETVKLHAAAGYKRLRATDTEAAFVAGLHHKFRDEGYGIDLIEAAHAHRIDALSLAKIATASRVVMAADCFDSCLTRSNNTSEEQYKRLVNHLPPSSRPHIDWLFEQARIN